MEKIKIDSKFIGKVVKEISEIASPSGMTEDAVKYIEKFMKKNSIDYEITHRGSLVAKISGKSQKHSITMTAHLDTLGAIVRGIDSNGRVKIFKIGGYNFTSVQGEYVTIHTQSGKKYRGTALPTRASVHVYKDTNNDSKSFEDMEIRLDEDVKTDKDVKKLGISTGDYISFDSRVEVLKNGYIKSRYLDDKAGVATLLTLIKMLKKNGKKTPYDLCFIFSVFEEVGGGVTGIPENCREFIAVDMGVIGEEHEGDEKKVSICPFDGSGPYNRDLFIKLCETAEKNKINYAKDIFLYYGSDASGVARASYNVKTGLIGPGVHASHSLERTHIKGIGESAKLLYFYTLNPLK